MKFHKQEHLVTPNNPIKRGSCYPTVIACLLDMELHDVPYFHLFYWTERERENFQRVFAHRYCNGNYETAEEYQKENYTRYLSMILNHWNNTLDFWLASQGYMEVYIGDINEWLKEHVDAPYMVSGKSSRGVQHVVIYQNGKMIHDPHPSNEGIIEFSEMPYSYLKKIE
jgi:hypothetical protein